MEFAFLQKVFWFLFFISNFLLANCQSCRNFFKFVQGSDGRTEGAVTIYLPEVPEHNLKVILSLGAQLTSTYVGDLVLYKGTSQSLEDLKNGLPVMYKIRFPLTSPLPKLSEIFHNNFSICKGEKEIAPFVTTITLNHIFKIAENSFASKSPFELHQTSPKPILDFQFPTENSEPAQSFYSNTRAPQNQKILVLTENSTSSSQKIFSSSSNNLQCGTRETSKVIATGLVIDGIKALRTDFPWLVAHYHIIHHFICGGSLVSNQIIVTAGHCIHEKGRSQPLSTYESTYYLGKFNLYDLRENGYISSDIQSFVVHPQWNPRDNSYDSDIAIAILVKKVIFSNTIRPICIWPQSNGHYDLVGKKGVIAGWGITQTGSVSEYPTFITAPAIDDGQCLRSNPGFLQLSSSTTFCVGDKSGNTPCRGDSGGAFAVMYGSQFYLRGIVSAAITNENGECSKNDYSLFTDVSFFTNWINEYVRRY